MKNHGYSSVTHCTHNEHGCEEVTIEKDRTLLQMLFRRPATVVVYEFFCGKWMNKNAGVEATWDECKTIEKIKVELRYRTCRWA